MRTCAILLLLCGLNLFPLLAQSTQTPNSPSQSAPSAQTAKPGSQSQDNSDAPSRDTITQDAKSQCRYDQTLKELDSEDISQDEKSIKLTQLELCMKTSIASRKQVAKRDKQLRDANEKKQRDLERRFGTVELTAPLAEIPKALFWVPSPPTSEPKTPSPLPPAITQGTQLTQSAWATPDACAVGSTGALAAKGILYVHRSLVWPKQASDDFGYRLGRRYMVYQVSITNAEKDFQYEVSDIVVDLKPIFTKLNVKAITFEEGGPKDGDQGYALFQASSQDLLMLRGVPEKGQDYDPRNMTLHILQGIGSVGAAVSGLTPFSDVMGPAMGNFNGAFLQAFVGIAPDHTATQLNRLSDMAFSSNTLIGKLQTKKFAIFIPLDFLMPKAYQNFYWKDPRSLLNILPFDQLNVCVDGILLVQAATTPDPQILPAESNVAPNSTISISDSAPGAAIHYTTNGDTPTTSSEKYTAPIKIGEKGSSLTVKAFATNGNEAPSNVVVRTFTAAAQATKPTLECEKVSKPTKVAITPANADDQVYYSLDDSEPNYSSPHTNGANPINLDKLPVTVKAKAIGRDTAFSGTASATCKAATQ